MSLFPSEIYLPYKVEIKWPIFAQLLALHDTRHHVIIHVAEIIKHSAIIINHSTRHLVAELDFSDLIDSLRYELVEGIEPLNHLQNILSPGPIAPSCCAVHLFPQLPGRHVQWRKNPFQPI